MTVEEAIVRVQKALHNHIAAHGSTAKPQKMYLPAPVCKAIYAKWAVYENKDEFWQEEELLYGVVVERTNDALLAWHFEDSKGNRFLMQE